MTAFQAPGRESPAPQGKRQRRAFPPMRRETVKVKQCTRLLRLAVCILGMQEHKAAQMQQPPNPCGLKSRRSLLRALDEQHMTRQRPSQFFVLVLWRM